MVTTRTHSKHEFNAAVNQKPVNQNINKCKWI